VAHVEAFGANSIGRCSLEQRSDPPRCRSTRRPQLTLVETAGEPFPTTDEFMFAAAEAGVRLGRNGNFGRSSWKRLERQADEATGHGHGHHQARTLQRRWKRLGLPRNN
jgi:hypothetical protein